jgi:hypothetical protein
LKNEAEVGGWPSGPNLADCAGTACVASCPKAIRSMESWLSIVGVFSTTRYHQKVWNGKKNNLVRVDWQALER